MIPLLFYPSLWLLCVAVIWAFFLGSSGREGTDYQIKEEEMERKKHRYLTIAIICWAVIAGLLLWWIEGRGEEMKIIPAEEMPQTPIASSEGSFIRINPELVLQASEPHHIMKITTDGHVYFDGVSIEKMNVPEIREIMIKILEEMRRNSLVEMMSRQTDYLLMELEKCRQLQERKE